MCQHRLRLWSEVPRSLLRPRIVAAVVSAVGSSVAAPCLGGQRRVGLLGAGSGSVRHMGSSAVAVVVAVVVAVAAEEEALAVAHFQEVGSAVAGHDREGARTAVVRRQGEVDSVVVGAPEGTVVVEGRTGRLAEAKSIAVGLVAVLADHSQTSQVVEGRSFHLEEDLLDILTCFVMDRCTVQ